MSVNRGRSGGLGKGGIRETTESHLWAVPNRHSGCTGGRAHRWAGFVSKPRAEGSSSNRKPLPTNDLTLDLVVLATREPAIPCHLGSDRRPWTSFHGHSPRFWQQRSPPLAFVPLLGIGKDPGQRSIAGGSSGQASAPPDTASAPPAQLLRARTWAPTRFCQGVARPARIRQVSRRKVATTRAFNESRSAKVYIRRKLIHERLTQRQSKRPLVSEGCGGE